MDSINKRSVVRLRFAYLCANCDVISEHSDNCPSCGSTALISLSKILNRRPDEKQRESVPQLQEH